MCFIIILFYLTCFCGIFSNNEEHNGIYLALFCLSLIINDLYNNILREVRKK